MSYLPIQLEAVKLYAHRDISRIRYWICEFSDWQEALVVEIDARGGIWNMVLEPEGAAEDCEQ